MCFASPLQLDALLIFNLLETQSVANLSGAIGACPLHRYLRTCSLSFVLGVSASLIRSPSRGLGLTCLAPRTTGITLSSTTSLPFPIELNINIVTPSPSMPYGASPTVLSER